MCGILGLYRPSGLFEAAETEKLLREAAALLKHRGPDASGVLVVPEGLGFAHRRLSIIDLDERSNQPMSSKDGLALITFNGEIYNFRELRQALEQEGVRFRTESDTEVLVEGYRLWGLERLLARISGMFAFALYDAQDRSLYLVRDRSGKKPLFYAEGSGLAFASELRALFKLLPGARELDPAGLDAYLTLKFSPSPGTLVKGVRKVPPGCYIRKKGAAQAELKRYWHPHQGQVEAPTSPAEALERIDAALVAAVRRRLVSDVPICLFLSGGIDSSLIAATLARLGVREMSAYSIGYKDLPGYNEFQYSRLVAERFPIRYQEITLESEEALELLEDSAALDEPISDWVWIPLYHLSRRAHQDGFKVALLGEGSDELFFGYDVMLKGLADLRRYAQPLGKALALAGSSLLEPVYRYASRGHRRYDLWRRAAAGEPVYMGSSVGFDKSQRHQVAGPRLLGSGNADAGRTFIDSLYRAYREAAPDPQDLANLVCYVEYYAKMSEMLLSRVDRVTMLHSLEARSPFLDRDLVELAFSLRGDWKIPGGQLKGLLRELAGRSLPEAVVRRRKMGFSFPFKEWLRGGLGAAVEKTFRETKLFQDGWVNGDFARRLLAQHRSGIADHAPRVWSLFSLARWYDRWIA